MLNTIKKYKVLLVGGVLGLILVYTVSQQIVNEKLSEYRLSISGDMSISENKLIEIEKLISRGGVNEVAANVMQDCTASERAEFEQKLGRLDAGLTIVELNDLDRLFSRCAPVSTIHRAVMLMQLRQEFQNYENLLLKRKTLGEYSALDEKIENWRTLLKAEEEVTDLSFNLVSLQKEIIDVLLTGVKINSSKAEDLKTRGQVIKNRIIVIIQEITPLRETLIST